MALKEDWVALRLVIALVVWAAAVVGAAALSSTVAGSIHNKAASTSGGGSFDASTVKAADSDSLFNTANLTKALTTVRKHTGADAKLDSAALYPGYLDLTLVKGGVESDFYIDARGQFDTNESGGSPGNDKLFGLSRIKASVPASLARRIAAAAKLPTSKLNYMVVEDDSIDGFRWLVYPVQGTSAEYFFTSGRKLKLFEYAHGSSGGPKALNG